MRPRRGRLCPQHRYSSGRAPFPISGRRGLRISDLRQAVGFPNLPRPQSRLFRAFVHSPVLFRRESGLAPAHAMELLRVGEAICRGGFSKWVGGVGSRTAILNSADYLEGMKSLLILLIVIPSVGVSREESVFSPARSRFLADEPDSE